MTDLPDLPSLLVTDAVRAALKEDLGRAGDITSAATIPADAIAEAVFGARQPGVLAGLALAEAAFREIDPSVSFTALKRDGDRIGKGEAAARVSGPARAILSAERVALNYLCHLSGVATATAALVAKVAHTKARICDTRKTTARPARLREIRGPLRRRLEPPLRPRRCDPDQGQPHRGRGRRGRGHRAGAGARRPHGEARGRGGFARDASRGAIGQARRRAPRQHDAGDAPRGGDDGGGEGSHRSLGWHHACRRWRPSPRPASTTSPPAGSPTPRRRWTSGWMSPRGSEVSARRSTREQR